MATVRIVDGSIRGWARPALDRIASGKAARAILTGRPPRAVAGTSLPTTSRRRFQGDRKHRDDLPVRKAVHLEADRLGPASGRIALPDQDRPASPQGTGPDRRGEAPFERAFADRRVEPGANEA